LIGRGAVFSRSVAVADPLIDVGLVLATAGPPPQQTTTRRRRFHVSGLTIGIVLTVLGFLLQTISFALSSDPSVNITALLVGMTMWTTGIVVVIISGILRIVKWQARRRTPATPAT
jgi:hypothetical protein